MQLLLPLGKAVCCAAANGITVDGDVSVALGEVMVTLLAERQPFVQTVRHLFACLVLLIQVVVVGITTLVVAHPYWFAAALVHTHHVFDTVHALHPVQIVVFQKLVALHWVHHSTRNTPLVGLLIEGHGASSLNPTATLVLHVVSVAGLIYCTPVKFRHVGRKQLGFAMLGLRWLINSSHFFHPAAAVILNDVVFLSTPFTKHIDCACNEL